MVRLTPAILQSSRDPKARHVLQQCITNLNVALGATGQFLNGDDITAADIGIWSLIALEETLKDSKDVNHIKAWFQRILDIPVVKKTIAAFPLSDLSLTAIQQSNPFGGFGHIKLEASPPATRSAVSTQVSESPSSVVSDLVTADEIHKVQEHFVFKTPEVEKEPRTV